MKSNANLIEIHDMTAIELKPDSLKRIPVIGIT